MIEWVDQPGNVRESNWFAIADVADAAVEVAVLVASGAVVDEKMPAEPLSAAIPRLLLVR